MAHGSAHGWQTGVRREAAHQLIDNPLGLGLADDTEKRWHRCPRATTDNRGNQTLERLVGKYIGGERGTEATGQGQSMTGTAILADDVNQLARARRVRRNRRSLGCGGERGNQGRTDKNSHMGKQRRYFHHAFRCLDSASEDGRKPGVIP